MWCPTCRALFRGGFRRCPHHGDELRPADTDPLVGTTLAERYVIEGVIGEGGLGRVYRARHVRMSRRYAIKVPFGDIAFDAPVRARFLREAEIASRLDHPNVVAALDVDETATGLLYMAMDLAEGDSLADLIGRGPLPRAHVHEVLGALLAGLVHAHERGVVHRDLKPDNIILTETGARIVDFGIAALHDDLSRRTRLTAEGTIIGTPEYMAPEQVTGQPVDARTDLFSLGVILYEMLAGVLPFDGAAMEVAVQHVSCDPPPIAERVPGLAVDPRLETLARWLMAKEPSARPQRADHVIAELRAIAASSSAGPVVTSAATLTIPAADVPLAVPVEGTAPAAPAAPRATTDAASLADVTPSAPSRRWPIAAALVLAPLVGLGAWSLGQAVRGEVAPVAPSAPELTVVAELTPAPVTTTSRRPPAPPVPPRPGAQPTPAKPAPTPTVPTVRPPTPRPAPAAAQVATQAPPAAEPISSSSLTAMYQRVGKALVDHAATHGEDATRPFRRRYASISYLEALRKPDLRDEALAELKALARDLGLK